jgi:outer membrane protein assembly factor BamB
MTATTPQKRRLRWWLLALILLLGATLIGFVRTIDSIETMNARNPATFLATLFTLLLVTVWYLSSSGLRWRTRLTSLLVAILVIFGLAASVRVEGFYGDIIPQFRWRWLPPRDHELTGARASHGTDRVDLRSTTPRDFPRFLGAQGRAVVEGVRLARDWSEQPPRQIWSQPIGAGWSAFSVVGDYAVTQEQRGESELVTCYELSTGTLRWQHEDHVRFSETMGGDGPRATPTIADGRVYAMGGTGILNCLDGGTGKVIWSRNVLSDHQQKNRQWGKSCSPLVFEDVVVVSLGEADEPSLVAYTGDSGRPLWRAGRDRPSYASPVLATLAEREQILMVNQASVSAHDPAFGDLLWEFPWPGDFAKCSQPVPIGDDRVFISAGYGIGCTLLEVKATGSDLSVSPLWSNRNMKTRFSNVVTRNGYVYGLDEGILACLELSTGRLKWKGGRYGHGQVLLVDDLLLVTTETGEIVLVEADPEGHHELTRYTVLSGKTWNNPALAGRFLLVRNAQQAACYELPLARPPSDSRSASHTIR